MVEAYGRRFLMVGDIVFGVLMGRIYTSFDGFKWFVERQDHKYPLKIDGFWSILALRDMADKSKIFVDVGAHVGKFTIRLAKYFRHVYAIEPNPLSYRILLENLKLNNISNVTTYQCACGRTHTLMILYDRGIHSTLLKELGDGRKIMVEVRRLDELVDEAHILKIDVEGYEYEVLQGAERIIREYKPIIYMEIHEKFRRGVKNKIINYLKGYVYIDIDFSHTFFFPEDYDFHKNLDKTWRVFASYWTHHIIKMAEEKRIWWYGLPSNWWYGCTPHEVIVTLSENFMKIAKEDDRWIKKAIKKCGG